MKKLFFFLLSLAAPFTIKSQQVDSIIDIRDSQIYRIVKIGQQWWMQENLNIGIMIDSSDYWADNDTIEKYCYRNNDSLCNIYGGLYEWSEMMDYSPSDNGNPGITRGICPIGWHLPTYPEWTDLVNLVGGESGDGGRLLKESGTTHWASPNTGATNGTGFTALPGGYRAYNTHFAGMGTNAYFWSSTSDDNPQATNRYAWFRILSYNNSEMSLSSYVKDQSFSVRCLRDAGQFSYLTISDKNLRTITREDFIHERITDTIIITNSAPGKTINITSIHTSSPAYNMTKSSAVLSSGDSIHLTITFHSLEDGVYYFDTLKIESNDLYNPVIRIPLKGFKPKTDSIVDIRDQQIYRVVKIGQQWWMQENLNVGNRINGSQNALDNGIIEKYCYDNILNSCNIYGGLYQWNEMMDYSFSDNENPGLTRGICPVGWHLPSDNEWAEMTEFMGGETIAGGNLKETGTIHWWDPNTGATNESGFTALPGGNRMENGLFHVVGDVGIFWSSTEGSSNYAWYMILDHNHSQVIPTNFEKILGLSVRCLMDSSQFSNLTVLDLNFKPVSFLNFHVDDISEEIILINSSPGKTINISSIYSNSSAFSLNESTSNLSPGDSIHLKVTFDPPGKNIYFDTIYIISDDPYKSLMKIPLIGTFPLEISFTDSSIISCYGYSDGSATVTPSLGTPPYQYHWNDPGNTTNSTVTGLRGNIYYRVNITDAQGWTIMDSISLSEPDPLIVLSDYSDFICPGSGYGFIHINPSGGNPPYIYSWSNGAVAQNVSGLSSGNYSVTITDYNGCEDTENFVINNILPYDSARICIVTIDLVSGKNIIVWEKMPDAGIETYNIYREYVIGKYENIGNRNAEELSIFMDETADPQSQSYLYKITITDTCGNASYVSSSKYHKPSFLQYVSSVGGINLSWTDYRIEGIDNIGDYLTSYIIYRGSDSSGLAEYKVVGSINNFTDTDPDALVRRYYYRVAAVLKEPCYPTGYSGRKDEPGPYTRSMSNIEDNRILVGLNDIRSERLSIYPNPFSDQTNLMFNNPDGHNYTLYIMDLSGKVCRIVDNINTSKFILEKAALKAGFYFIELRGEKLYRERIIVE